MQNFVYLVGDTEEKKCWIVDPAWDVETALAQAEKDGYGVAGALLTHSHYDHCNALDKLLKARDVPVYVHKREPEIAQKAVETGIFGFLPTENLKAVESGDKITLGRTTLTFLHTPGHTPGSQCFLVGNSLISGDTLFLGTCGRCDLPGGNPYEMHESLNRKIAKLPGDTVLFPGHNYNAPPLNGEESPSTNPRAMPAGFHASDGTFSTLEAERKRNRFLQARSLDDFLSLVGL